MSFGTCPASKTLLVSREEWEAGEAPVEKGEGRLVSSGTRLASKRSTVSWEEWEVGEAPVEREFAWR